MQQQTGDVFWYEKVDVLWQPERLTEFFPTKDQTVEERFNAMMRLSIYMSILLYFHHKNYKFMSIAVGMALFTCYIYYQKPQSTEKAEEFGGENASQPATDSNQRCTPPTIDNPFMNVTMKDYMNIQDGKIVDRPSACDTSDPTVKKAADEFFDNNLYKDVSDVFGKFNSQRQFYTMPWTTIPNKQDEFARWLYASPATCKEDQDFCLRYEDVRAKRPVVAAD